MSKSASSKKTKFPTEKLAGWDGLIASAKQRIQELEFSITVFEQKKASGEPAPRLPQSDSALILAATQKARTAKEAIPA